TRFSRDWSSDVCSSDLLDPLGAVETGDVEQTVPPREDVDEGAELGDGDDLAVVLGAHLDLWREGDLGHPLLGGGESRAVVGGDPDDALAVDLFDLDGGTGDLFELTDDCALGTDDLTDLVLRDLEGLDARRPLV